MFYHYLRFINLIFIVFGMKKPFLFRSGRPDYINIGNKIWSIIVAAVLIASYILPKEIKKSINQNDHLNSTKSIKINIEEYDKVNDVVINVLVIALVIGKGQIICTKLYEGITRILQELRVADRNLKMITVKFYLGLVVTATLMIAFVILEVLDSDTYILLYSLPTFLATFHLVLHLSIILSILKTVTLKMSDMLTLEQKVPYNAFLKAKPKWEVLQYFLNPDMKFMEVNRNEHFELKFLCKIYDDLNACIQLLEQYHGIQMLLTFWLIFTKAVFGVTMIVCNITNVPVLVFGRSILPFVWCFYGCYVNGEIQKQVEDIDMLIVKYMIDFRCDPTRKTILQTFKQLVDTNRLQFTACSLFHLNYSMILGTLVNVITYSIILIQLFISETTE